MAPDPARTRAGKRSTSPSKEQYIETIAHLLTDQKVCSVSDIAEGANVSRAAASRAVRDLAAQDLVEHKAYGYVDLTAKGHELAGELTARHEAICRFLRDVLGFAHDAADEEACRLEHLLEDETVDRLAALASFFETDAKARSRWKHHFENGLNT